MTPSPVGVPAAPPTSEPLPSRRQLAGRAILRAYAIAMGVVLVALLISFLDFVFLCDEKHQADQVRQNGGQLGTLRTLTFAVARSGDEMVVCRTRHCYTLSGHPFICHEDIACFCAATEGNPDEREIARRLGKRAAAVCQIENRNPRRDDRSGACPEARCLRHIDGPKPGEKPEQ
jgi:hypothetical protein